MKAKTMAAAAAALCLTACTSALLWTTNVTDNPFVPMPLAIATDSVGNTYQLYLGSSGYTQLRKLDAGGNELWQQEVGAAIPETPLLHMVVTPTGVAVGYNEMVGVVEYPFESPTPNILPLLLADANLKQFDADGAERWHVGFQSGESDILTGMTLDAAGNLVVAVHLGRKADDPLTSSFSLQRFDSTGIQLSHKESVIATIYCLPFCTTEMAIDTQGNLLFNFAGPFYTYSIVQAADGSFPWRSTGIPITPNSLLMPLGKHISNVNDQPNHVVATANGFVTTNGTDTWENTLTGSRTWRQSFGSTIGIAVDATGTLYIPNGVKISKLASDGTLISDITLDGQSSIRQIEWREDLQRLIVLSDFSTSTSNQTDATITEETGQTLWVFDAAGKKKASYKTKPTRQIKPVCEADVECGDPVWEQGETWEAFTTTPDKRIVLSGAQLSGEATAFAKAFKLL